MPAALLFDLDGTLVDSAPAIAEALSHISIRRGGRVVTPQEVRPLVSLGAPTLVRRALGVVAQNEAADLAEFRDVLGELEPNPADIFDGVKMALSILRGAGYPMAIVTNKPEALSRQLLAKLGMAQYFPVIVGGDTAQRPKPDPEPVRLALALLGEKSSNAIFIGDSVVDAGAARAAGMPFILYEGGYGAEQCNPDDITFAFSSFGDLHSIIGSIVLADAGKI